MTAAQYGSHNAVVKLVEEGATTADDCSPAWLAQSCSQIGGTVNRESLMASLQEARQGRGSFVCGIVRNDLVRSEHGGPTLQRFSHHLNLPRYSRTTQVLFRAQARTGRRRVYTP